LLGLYDFQNDWDGTGGVLYVFGRRVLLWVGSAGCDVFGELWCCVWQWSKVLKIISAWLSVTSEVGAEGRTACGLKGIKVLMPSRVENSLPCEY
jgi:hypothetical protein